MGETEDAAVSTDNITSMAVSAPSVASVAVKLPPLSIKAPGVWFRRAEAKFRLSGISSSITMADHTLSAMSEGTADLFQAWLSEQPEELRYEDLKDYIMSRFSLPASERAQRALKLAEQPLGDSTARDRWEELQSLLILPATDDDKAPKVSLEREIFLQGLPDPVRQGLPNAHTLVIKELITQADRLLDAHKATKHRAPTFEVSTDNVDICAATQASRNQRGKQNDNPTLELCFYHARFGENAKKCRPNCPKWSKNGQVGRQ